MGKLVHDSVLDAALDEIATANIMTACSGEPTDRADAITDDPTGVKLADIAMTPGDTNDYTVGEGDTSGRKVTMDLKAGVTIDVTGTATHIALCDDTNLLYVTTCSPQGLVNPGTVTFPAWDIEIADPSA